MERYYLDQETQNNAYPVMVFSVSYKSPLEEILLLEEELNGTPCDVLFDLLLCNGVASNRYLVCTFNGENFEYKTFRPISSDELPMDIRENSVAFYQQHPEYVENSILPQAQQFLVRKGKELKYKKSCN